jgi:dynein heavy chain, axonemal
MSVCLPTSSPLIHPPLLYCTLLTPQVFEIENTKDCSLLKWRTDLKEILIACCAHSAPTVLVLSEEHMAKEILEDISDLLTTGEVPSLYQPEDIERILGKS